MSAERAPTPTPPPVFAGSNYKGKDGNAARRGQINAGGVGHRERAGISARAGGRGAGKEALGGSKDAGGVAQTMDCAARRADDPKRRQIASFDAA